MLTRAKDSWPVVPLHQTNGPLQLIRRDPVPSRVNSRPVSSPSSPSPPRESGVHRFKRRVGRHIHWAREQGTRRLIEEDQLNPFERVPLAVQKWRWRRAHHVAPNSVPVYLVGVQRSGTNMITRGLEHSPEFEVFSENDKRAFDRFFLRPDDQIRSLVVQSGHRYSLFKPLIDSHRVVDLLDTLGTPSPGRAIWAYRSMEGRVRSAVTKFGTSNLDAMRAIAEGHGTGMWQAGGLTQERLRFIEGFDYSTMSPKTGAAIFWFVRNSLYFDLGLDAREDVTLACYDEFTTRPEPAMRALTTFLGMDFDPELVAHVRAQPNRPARTADPEIDPAVTEVCGDLFDRLEAARTRSND
jgi:hypothetical protein